MRLRSLLLWLWYRRAAAALTDLTLSLGTSICYRCNLKKKSKEKNKRKHSAEARGTGVHKRPPLLPSWARMMHLPPSLAHWAGNPLSPSFLFAQCHLLRYMGAFPTPPPLFNLSPSTPYSHLRKSSGVPLVAQQKLI